MAMMTRVGARGKRGLRVFQEQRGAALCVHVSGSFHAPPSSPAYSRRGNPSTPFVEAAESHGPKVEIPFAVVDRFEPDVFANQDPYSP